MELPLPLMRNELAQNVSRPVAMAVAMRSEDVRWFQVLNKMGRVLSSAFSIASSSAGSELMRENGFSLPGEGRTYMGPKRPSTIWLCSCAW